MSEGFGREKERPLFMIRVVSQMLDVHPQTLRIYEKEGFITPSRAGGRRLYSQADVERLSLILDLTREMGVNRAGVDIILRMRDRLESLQQEVEEMMGFLEEGLRDDFEEKIRRIFSEGEEES
jgi:MerR family transcriptional regulator/heat shock protein HspR